VQAVSGRDDHRAKLTRRSSQNGSVLVDRSRHHLLLLKTISQYLQAIRKKIKYYKFFLTFSVDMSIS
jgi:hypothetical protein